MKLEAITTERLIQKLTGFISSTPAEKAAYGRKRALMLEGTDLSELSDDVILGHLVSNENLMQQFIERYEVQKSTITPGLVLDNQLLAITNEFINVAVTAGIESILLALKPGDEAAPAPDQALDAAIDALFASRDHLPEKFELLLSLINTASLVSEVVYVDFNTYNKVFLPETESVDGAKELYGVAYLSFMGVEMCMLIHQRCLEVNEIYMPKVSGFSHEFYMSVVLHELTHLLLNSDDLAYGSFDVEHIKDYNVYSMSNLKARDLTNADNYVTLIFIAMAQLHRDGRLDLGRF